MDRSIATNRAGTDGTARIAGLILLGWGCGAAGIAVLGFSRTLVLRFMTDHLGVSALAAGALFAFSKLVDAASDPLMGIVSDRTATRWGRRLPYLFAGTLLCAAAYPLMFGAPALAAAHAALYMAVAFVFYAIAYTVFHVPYLAMAADIAPDYQQRSRLMSARAVGIAAGSLLAGVIGPLAIAAHGGGLQGHRAMAWSLAAMTLALLLIGAIALAQAPFGRRERVGALESLRGLRSLRENRPYLRLLLAKTCFVVGVSMLTTLSAYFVTHVLAAPDTRLALFFGAFFVGVILGQPLWLITARRHEKQRVYIVACTSLALINLSWLAAGPVEGSIVFVVRSIAIGASMGGAMTIGLSMLADTFEHDVRLVGLRREGLLAGLYTTVEKAGAALGIAMVAISLKLSGYAESDGGSSTQAVETLYRLQILFAVAPALALGASAFVMRNYALDARALAAPRSGTERPA